MINAILVSTAAVVLFWIAAPFALREKSAGREGLDYVWLVLAFGALVAFTISTLKLFLIMVSVMLSMLFTILSVAVAVGVVIWLVKMVSRKSK